MFFNSAKKHANRIGSKMVKVKIAIKVLSLTVPTSSIANNSVLSVCFERGGKMSTSKNILLETDKTKSKEAIVGFNDVLELVCTLYRDTKTGIFQNKDGKVILRQLVKNAFGGDSFLGLGMYHLRLNELADELNFDQISIREVVLPLDRLKGASLRAEISTSLIKSNAEGDETLSSLSLLSADSDMSTLGAHFEHTAPRPSAAGEDEYGEKYEVEHKHHSHHRHHRQNRHQVDSGDSSSSSVVGNKKTAQRYKSATQESIKEIYNEEDDDNYESTTFDSSLPTPPIHTATLPNSSTTAGEKLAMFGEPKAMKAATHKSISTSAVDTSGGSNISATATELEQEVMEIDNRLSSWSIKKGDSKSKLKQSKALMEATKMHKNEILVRLQQMDRMESTHKTEVDCLRSQITSLQLEVTRLHSEVEKKTREQIATSHANADSDQHMTGVIKNAREDTDAMAADLRRVQAELKLSSADVLYYKELAEQAIKDRAEERRAVQESAAAAVKAVIKRADVETENENLLSELIDIKVNFSNMAIDFDRELKRNSTLKKRLQVYAERVAKLELKNNSSNK